MFTINKKGIDNARADTSLLILPTTSKQLEGKPEEIKMIRDEVANMVWGIEIVPLPSGTKQTGAEAAQELFRQYQHVTDQEIEDGSITPKEPVDYKAVSVMK